MIQELPTEVIRNRLFVASLPTFAWLASLICLAWSPLQAQQGNSSNNAPARSPNASMSVTWSYSYNNSGCPYTGYCVDDSESEHFSGNATLDPADGGFEGEATGHYTKDLDNLTRPSRVCPSGASSSLDTSGSADFVVHAQCSIDNSITGGPDTSHMDRDTTVVEVQLGDYDLHVESASHQCDGSNESWAHDSGAVGFGCFFYGVSFDAPGNYTYNPEVVEGVRGTCTLDFNPAPKGLRIYGKVMGQGGNRSDRQGPFPISNSRVVAMRFDETRLKKLSESQPPFDQKTATSDDDKAKYEMHLQLCDKPPKVVVVSALWSLNEPIFAVTNGPDRGVGKPDIPVYLAACVDDDPRSKCHKWKEVPEGYEVEVNFEYGDATQVAEQDSFMDAEVRQGYSSIPDLLKETAYMYYNTYRQVKYFEAIGFDYPKNPLMLQSHYLGGFCPKQPTTAWFRGANFAFGGLGRHLPTFNGKGGIFFCKDDSPIDYPDAPMNREWHEFGHYLLWQMYYPFKACPAGRTCKSHGGYGNGSTNWALIEGFATFTAALTNEHYGNPEPYIYPIDSSVVNLDLAYKVWGLDLTDEENALAGILWDLHDSGREIALNHTVLRVVTEISKVYPPPIIDQVALDAKNILQVIKRNSPRTAVDLLNAFSANQMSQTDKEMIFLDHGFFADIVERDYIHASATEAIGESGNAPLRMYREKQPPAAVGSNIVADKGGAFEVVVTLAGQSTGQYDYSYALTLQPGVPAYFTMPPEYYPSNAAIFMVSGGKKVGGPVLEISSEEYWQYIRNNPEATAVFKAIPAKRAK